MRTIKRAISAFICAVMVIGAMPVSAMAAGIDSFLVRRSLTNETFTDVSGSDWFYDNVRSVYELGLMVGDSATTFNPNGLLTLAEAVTISARLNSIYNTGEESFQSGEPWYNTYVDYATEKGILPFEILDYSKPATRAEFAQILELALPDSELEEINDVADGIIPDVNSAESYADAVYKLYRAGILVGNDVNGTFSPYSNISRCEVSAIVSRMADPSLRRFITLPKQDDNTEIPENVPETKPSGNTGSKPDTDHNRRRYYTVTFRSNAGDDKVYNMPESQKVKAGGYAEQTEEPERDGYKFVAWCTKDGNLFAFNRPIKSNVVLYAQWTQVLENENADTDYIYEQKTDNINFDSSENMLYFNNIINVMTNDALSDDEAEELADVVGGKVAGQLNGEIPFIQILIPSADYDEITSLIELLNERDEVYSAFLDIPIPVEENSVTDPWKELNTDSDQNDLSNEDKPNGNDWWAEAICAYTAWDNYTQYASPIKVGVIDKNVDFSHIDLKGKATPLYSSTDTTEIGSEHGTHVAGLIAAANNSYGIRGVADFIGKGDLICAEWNEKDTPYLTAAEILKISADMCESGAKVINCSLGIIRKSKNGYLKSQKGFSKLLNRFNASYDEYLKTVDNDVYEISKLTAKKMCYLIEHGKGDFIAVQAAGNGWDGAGTDGYDSTLNGYYAGITSKVYNDVKKETNTSVEFSELIERIIIVGSVENTRTSDENGNWVYSVFKGSNSGSHTTIFAPGVDILSLRPNNKFLENQEAFKNSCRFETGTSMAAPIVSGAAALVWAINPDLEPGEVRSMLIWETDQRAKGVGDDHLYYQMLNIGMAAKAAYESLNISEEENGVLSGYVYGESDDNPLNGVEITIVDDDGTEYKDTTDSDGSFEIELPVGKYDVSFKANGYATDSTSVTISKNEATKVERYLERETIESEIIASGKCGDNLTWKVTADGTLIISGTGEMYNYRSSATTGAGLPKAPWKLLDKKPTTLVLEEGITRTGNHAFDGCYYIGGTLNIPKSLKIIGEGSFMSCGISGKLIIPDNVNLVLGSAFNNCKGLTDVEFSKNMTAIDAYTFFGCKGLTTLDIPENITSIGQRAFNECSLSRTLEIPDSVTYIGDAAFATNPKLEEVKLPSKLTVLSDYVFSSTGIKSIIVPEGVEKVGNWAFRGCGELEGVYFKGDAPAVKEATNYNQSFPKEAIIYYPMDNDTWLTGDAYDAENGTWNGYKIEAWH